MVDRSQFAAANVAIGLVLLASTIARAKDVAPNWKKLEADNGAVYQIDLNSNFYFNNGTADIVVYAVSNSGFNPENMHRLWFDCHGQYRDTTGPSFGPTMNAPPNSMVGRISQIACAGAKDTRLEDSSRPQPKDTPAQYCKGFSPEACARIVAAVEGKSKPSYCKPGFALVGSGLNAEQLRICYVIGSEEVRTRDVNKNPVAPASQSRTYDLTLSATRSNFPSIIGSTNLPDDTKLLVSIEKPRLPNASELLAKGLPMCEDNCFPASGPKGETLGVATTVLAGAFSAGPFSWAGKPFQKGTFKVEVFLVSLPGEASGSPAEYDERQSGRMKKPVLTSSVNIAP